MANFFDKLPVAIQVAILAGAFVFGAIFSALAMRMKNGKDSYVTKYEMLVALNEAAANHRKERQDFHTRIDRMQAEFKLDLGEADNHLSEFAKSVDDKLHSIERGLNRLLGAEEVRRRDSD